MYILIPNSLLFLVTEFNFSVHLRVNDTTVEVSHVELPQNFPDALQIAICNATLHYEEDVQPNTTVVPCNPLENLVLFQLNDRGPGTMFANVPIHINGTDLTCNVTTNRVELSTDDPTTEEPTTDMYEPTTNNSSSSSSYQLQVRECRCLLFIYFFILLAVAPAVVAGLFIF